MNDILENTFNFIDKYYHFKKISKYVNKLQIKNVIDVGFHKGEFIKNVLTEKNIYAFEANKEIYKLGQKKFNNKKNIKIFNYCLSNKISNRKFHINHLSSTSSLLKGSKFFNFFKNLSFNNKKLKNYLNLKTYTLDYAIKKSKINLDCSFLKIDVEGAEYLVLKGVKKNIHKISYILLENKFYSKNSFTNLKKINFFLAKNKFILIKKFIYPLLNFEDRLYAKKHLPK